MESIKLHAHVGDDGILKLEFPTMLTNQDVEILVVLHPINEPVDELGWPLGFFDRTYGTLADDPLERPIDLPPDVRDFIKIRDN